MDCRGGKGAACGAEGLRALARLTALVSLAISVGVWLGNAASNRKPGDSETSAAAGHANATHIYGFDGRLRQVVEPARASTTFQYHDYHDGAEPAATPLWRQSEDAETATHRRGSDGHFTTFEYNDHCTLRGGQRAYAYNTTHDTSRRRAGPAVLERDAQGRVTLERDGHGWHVAYCRDEFGNVIEKKWTNPKEPNNCWVRLYTFDMDRRLVAEADIHGRRRLIDYDESGRVVRTRTPEGSIEAAQQHKFIMQPHREAPRTRAFEYDERGHRSLQDSR